MGAVVATVVATPVVHDQAPVSNVPATNTGTEELSEEGKQQQEDDSGMCVVCLERRADTAVVPCGHMCGCETCLKGLQASKHAECPMCRGPVTSTIRIYRG